MRAGLCDVMAALGQIEEEDVSLRAIGQAEETTAYSCFFQKPAYWSLSR